MADSVYRVTELVGTSSTSWEAAAKSAIETAAKSLRDLRVAEVVRQDVTIEDGKVGSYRVSLNVSFRYEDSPAKSRAASGRADPALRSPSRQERAGPCRPRSRSVSRAPG